MRTFITLLLLAILAAGGWFAWALVSSVTPASQIFVLLRPGYSTRRIAAELKSAGLAGRQWRWRRRLDRRLDGPSDDEVVDAEIVDDSGAAASSTTKSDDPRPAPDEDGPATPEDVAGRSHEGDNAGGADDEGLVEQLDLPLEAMFDWGSDPESAESALEAQTAEALVAAERDGASTR